MSGCFHIVEKFEFAYGEGLFSDRLNDDGERCIDAFLDKLGNFGVTCNITEELGHCWFNAVEIGVGSFTNFYQNHIENKASISRFDEEELRAISKIKEAIDSDADYIKRYGCVFLTHI